MLKQLYESSNGQIRLLLTVLLDHLGRPRECRTPVEMLMQIQGVKLKAHTRRIKDLRELLRPLGYGVHIEMDYKKVGNINVIDKTYYRIALLGLEGTFAPPVQRETWWGKIKKFFTF